MTETIAERASRVIDAVHSSSSIAPDAGDGEPFWYYDLCSRVALLIGPAPIRFVSHSFTPEYDQDGELWLFTDALVVHGVYVGDGRTGDLRVEAFARTRISKVTVDFASSAFGTIGARWPSRLQVTLSIDDKRVVLPVGIGSNQLGSLVELLPTLLNGAVGAEVPAV